LLFHLFDKLWFRQAVGTFDDVRRFGTGSSRSFGTKNNDPLEAIVFIGLFERRSWVGGAYETNRRGGEENLFDELNSTLNVGKT
jgi:hypothetical protein